MKYDYLIVGAGWAGSVLAYKLTEAGKKCLVIDGRNHIGGLAYTEQTKNITIHKYGPHIFHTSSPLVWYFVNQFDTFVPHHHTIIASNNHKLYSFPINLLTLHQVFGVETIEDAKLAVKKDCLNIDNPINMEEWCLANVGKTLYELFIRDYTIKQWGKSPTNLSPNIIKRIPIRYDFNSSYYNDTYVAIPMHGYTKIFKELLANSVVWLGCDFLKNKKLIQDAGTVICTIPLDTFCEYVYGPLSYLGLDIQYKYYDKTFQGVSIINYTGNNVKHTRVTEHKFFDKFINVQHTIISTEYPMTTIKDYPYYPAANQDSTILVKKYQENLQKRGIYFCGRFGEYKYMDQTDVIESALKLSERIL